MKGKQEIIRQEKGEQVKGKKEKCNKIQADFKQVVQFVQESLNPERF